MQQPLLSGDVWIGFDHIARLLDALRQKPDDFVAFPAPAGSKGRGYMPVLAGLAVVKGAPDVNGAMALIDYLTQSQTIGLGQRGSEFDKVFMDTFQLIVLRGQKPRAVLDREAETLNRLMTKTAAPCWQPDPASVGACQVQ